jgi:hypothetical protein
MGDDWDAHVPRVDEDTKHSSCSFCGKNQSEVRKLVAGPSVHICDECVELCKNIVAEDADVSDSDKAEKAAKAKSKTNRLCGICMEPRETDELIFLPHTAYMCAGCLEEIQAVRDRQDEK